MQGLERVLSGAEGCLLGAEWECRGEMVKGVFAWSCRGGASQVRPHGGEPAPAPAPRA